MFHKSTEKYSPLWFQRSTFDKRLLMFLYSADNLDVNRNVLIAYCKCIFFGIPFVNIFLSFINRQIELFDQ